MKAGAEVPAVITYWQLKEDEDNFFAYLTTTGRIVAMPDHWAKTKEELAPRLITDYVAQKDPHQFVIGLGHHALAAGIEPRQKDGEEYFSLAYMSSCLIAYQRGRTRDEKKLGLSNLAAYWTYPDKEVQTILTKDEDFLKWAKKVFAWVRRHTPEQIVCNRYPYRATKRAKYAADASVIEPVLY
jgi:hypothetical protein